MIKTEYFDYFDDNTALQGFCAYEDNQEKKAAVLVAHDWSGKNEFACERARKLAALGYVGIAIDMFGKDKRGQTKEEKSALIAPLMQDRASLQRRILAGFNAAKTLPQVDAKRIGAIGFCFGGLCVLDLARSGAPVKGVVSFHGLLQAPEFPITQPVEANILALHGFDDPMVTPDQVTAFGREMTHAKAKWEINIYGHTMHAFTNPEANDPDFGTVYNGQADLLSGIAMERFFERVFG